MPQMAPLSWLMLMIFFSWIFLMFNMINFYNFLYKPKILSHKKSNFKLNWKW